VKIITNPNKKQVERYLKKIGWTLRHHGCENYYFYNHKNKNTGMRFFGDRIDVEGVDYKTPSITFFLKEVVMELLENETVCFRGKTDKSIFILCHNFDTKKYSPKLEKKGSKTTCNEK